MVFEVRVRERPGDLLRSEFHEKGSRLSSKTLESLDDVTTACVEDLWKRQEPKKKSHFRRAKEHEERIHTRGGKREVQEGGNHLHTIKIISHPHMPTDDPKFFRVGKIKGENGAKRDKKGHQTSKWASRGGVWVTEAVRVIKTRKYKKETHGDP